jgi:surface antigen
VRRWSPVRVQGVVLAVIAMSVIVAGGTAHASPVRTGVSAGTALLTPSVVIGDDYPANLRNAAQDSVIDPWRFYNRECTSFVAWRLNSRNGVAFNDYYRGPLWGNANNWGNAARSLGIPVNSTPAVGSVAWSNAGTFGHVAWVSDVNADGTINVEEYNYALTGAYHVRYNLPASTFTGYIHIADLASSVGDGSFVSYQGNVYRVAGGAPVYVSTWNAFGGAQPTTALSDAQFAGLRNQPADGTFLRGTATGQIYRIAGGAPVYVSTWNAFGGGQPTIDVDQAALDNAGGGGVWNHLNYRPSDGSFLRGTATGQIYRMAGGAPLYVSTWAAFGGGQPTVDVDQAALDNAGGGGVWNHISYRPVDGTFVNGTATGQVYRFAGGAPVYVSTWGAYGGVPQPSLGVDQAALDNAGAGGAWNHASFVPADHTFITGNQTGQVYQVLGGVPYYVSSWAQVGGPKPTVGLDQGAIDNAGAGGLWNHLASAVPTVAATAPAAAVALPATATLSWASAPAQASAVTTYDARWARAPWNGGFSTWQYPASWQGTTVHAVTIGGISPGWDYCFSVRVHNRAGLVSGWTANRCVARPLDDVSLVASRGWIRSVSSVFYGGSVLSSTTLGATLTRTAVQADRVALLATTCASCGTVGVYLNGVLLGKVSLVSATTRRDVLLTLPRFTLRATTVTVKVLTSGRTVQVDGLGLSRT